MSSPELERTYQPVDPATRPRRSRTTVRVIMVDAAGRTLLFCDSDPGVPDARWWMTPGGGRDPGESEAETAVREVGEETGYAITADDLIGPLARRHVVHGYSDQVIEQDEVFYLVHVDDFAVDISAHTEDEQLTILDHRWWAAAELAETEDEIWPAELVQLWRLAEESGPMPLDLGRQEESTVPDRVER
jgi:8-oxo-dGTP pyrophosphatase MutT (NUDIX family)